MEIKKIDQVARFGRQAKRKRRRLPSITVPESGLQKQIQDTLDIYHVKYVHIENSFWNWFNVGYADGDLRPKNVPPDIYFPFTETFAGMPDIVAWEKIGKIFNLSYTPELKTPRGTRNQNQKEWAKEINIPILRTTEENEAAVVDFVKMAKQLREILYSAH